MRIREADFAIVGLMWLGFLTPWWLVEAARFGSTWYPGAVSFPFVYWSAGLHGYGTDALGWGILVANLTLLAGAALVLAGTRKRLLLAIGAGVLLVGVAASAYLQAASLPWGIDAPDVKVGSGVPLMVLAAVAALARYQLIHEGHPIEKRRAWQGAAVFGAVLAIAAMQFAPLWTSDVALDPQGRYHGSFSSTIGGHMLVAWPQEYQMDLGTWGYALNGEWISNEYHTWWSTHYFENTGNTGLYVAGVLALGAMIMAGAAIRVRRPRLLLATAAMVGLAVVANRLGSIAELHNDEYVQATPLAPAWGLVLALVAVVLLVVAARMGPQADGQARPAAEPDRNP